MLFRQLFLTAIRSMTVKKLFGSSCGLNSDIFSTARAEGLVSQVAPAAATHILYRRTYVVNRGIVRSVSQQQVHKCRILSDKYHRIFSEKNIWQVIMCQLVVLADSSCAHLILSYFIMHCKCDRGPKQVLHTCGCKTCMHFIHQGGRPTRQDYSQRRRLSCTSEPLKSVHTVHMHEPAKGKNALFHFKT